MQNQPSPARSIALFIIMIGLLAAGLSASVAVSGATKLALQICGGAVVLAIIVLIVGAFIVASSGTDNTA